MEIRMAVSLGLIVLLGFAMVAGIVGNWLDKEDKGGEEEGMANCADALERSIAARREEE